MNVIMVMHVESGSSLFLLFLSPPLSLLLSLSDPTLDLNVFLKVRKSGQELNR